MNFYNERRYSYITEEFPDPDKFPLYYKAKKQEFTLQPGDIYLFLLNGLI